MLWEDSTEVVQTGVGQGGHEDWISEVRVSEWVQDGEGAVGHHGN